MNDIREVVWDKIKLTVVMPSYNRGQYIRQAIDSVLSQKCRFRILLAITDDASTDGTREIITEYEKKYPDKILIMFSERNCGLLANDIKVFSYMKSDYFCVLDPDDYWIDDNFLDKAVSFLEDNPDYVTWGANTRIMRNGELSDEIYIHVDFEEKTVDGIEDYLNGQAAVPHTTAAVYRNAIFKNGVPDIIRNAVGTLSEASFRGDADRYVIHLKYGRAKFVNECVGVYRIHEQGICQGRTMFHWMLMNARAELDYSDYYDGKYEEQFRQNAKRNFKKVCVEVYKAAADDAYFYMDEYDKENFAVLMNRLCV